MAKNISFYLSDRLRSILDLARQRGVAHGSDSAAIMSLISFATFRLHGPIPETVRASEALEADLRGAREAFDRAMAAHKAAGESLAVAGEHLARAEAAHATLRDDVANLFAAARIALPATPPTAAGAPS